MLVLDCKPHRCTMVSQPHITHVFVHTIVKFDNMLAWN